MASILTESTANLTSISIFGVLKQRKLFQKGRVFISFIFNFVLIPFQMFSRLDPKKALKSAAIVASAGTVAFCGLDLLCGSEKFYAELVMPLVQKFIDAETAHNWAVKLCSHRLVPPFGQNYREYKRLETSVWGIPFKNPVGLAAGFDKVKICYSSFWLLHCCKYLFRTELRCLERRKLGLDL